VSQGFYFDVLVTVAGRPVFLVATPGQVDKSKIKNGQNQNQVIFGAKTALA